MCLSFKDYSKNLEIFVELQIQAKDQEFFPNL